MSHDISKQINCITQTTKNNCNNNINLIPVCHYQKNKKENLKKKINTKLIKRKNTYSKDSKDKKIKIKERIKIAPLLIKRNKSLNLDTLKNIKINKSRYKKNNLSLNSLNINNNIYNNLSNYYRKYNIIYNNNKISIKKKINHQRYPTISSVQYALLNNYKIISANLRNKNGSSHKTLSNHLHKNCLSNKNRNIIHYKKICLDINNNHRRINSFTKFTEKETNKNDILEDIN